jgi:hypothetical protein
MDTKRHRSTAASWALALGAVTTVAGCSLALDWDPNNQPCDQGKCLGGYTCVGDICIGDHSIDLGGTCLTDLQCKDSVCTGPGIVGYACRKKCDTYFLQDTCDADSYCRPSRDPASAGGASRGSCVKSECNTDADCQKELKIGTICVKIGDSVGACLFACKDPSGANGIPSCTTVSNAWDVGSTQYCQPLGKAVRLVCLQQSSSPQGTSAICGNSVTSATCNGLSGLMCMANQCRLYCNAVTKAPCSTAANCTVVQTADSPVRTFGYCQSP